MGSVELDYIRVSLNNARSPEEVFGTLVGTQTQKLEAAKKVFRQVARSVHPDLYQGTTDFEQAHTIFKKLSYLWEQAQRKIENGTYSTAKRADTFTPFVIRTQKRQYTVEKFLAEGDLYNIYQGISTLTDTQKRFILKLPIQLGANDLVMNETRILKHLKGGNGYEKQRQFWTSLWRHYVWEER